MGRAPKRIFTTEELQFIEDNWTEMTDGEIAETLNTKHHTIKNQRKRLGLKKHSKDQFKWTDEEIEILKSRYPNTPNKQMVDLLPGRKLNSIIGKARTLGVIKPEEYLREMSRKQAEINLAEIGKQYRFRKGHESHTKGKKVEEFMSPEQVERFKSNQFKPGNKPHNTKFDGAVTIRQDSNGHKYMWIRISEGNWEEYHRHLYKKHFGAIPKGLIVRFKDGNTLNCSPENLEAISPAEHLEKNNIGGRAAEKLTDRTVAYYLSGRDPELQEYILTHRPDLIKTARAYYQLNREIAHAEQQ